MEIYKTIDGKITANFPYFQAPNAAFEQGLNCYELVVFLYLTRCANHGGTAFPSYQTIADKCGVSRSTAKRVITDLENKGLIIKTVRSDPNTRQNFSNVYNINILV